MSDNIERISAARIPEPLNVEHISTSTWGPEGREPEDMLPHELSNLRLESDSGSAATRNMDTENLDPLGWLTVQIQEQRDQNAILVREKEEMRRKMETLEYSLAQWKLNAQETTDHLRRVISNRDKPNYVDAFYDAKTKRLLQSLAEENLYLRSELGNDGTILRNVNCLAELQQRIQLLNEQLKIRSVENYQLRDQMRCLSTPHPDIDEMRHQMTTLNNSNLELTVENSTLRNHTNKQMEILTYLKSQFSKLRNEFLQLYAEQVSSDQGEEFLKQLKSLDGEAAPAFLSKPLISRADSTNANETRIVETENLAPLKRVQRDEDSGIGSLNEEQRELVSKSRELEETKVEVNRLSTENSRLKAEMEEVANMKRLATKASEQAAQSARETNRLREENDRLRREREEAKNEALSWHAALRQFQREGSSPQPQPQVPQPRYPQPYASRSINTPTQMGGNVREPFQSSPFAHHQLRGEPILVRDGGLKQTSKTSIPTESQETTTTFIPPPRAGAGPLSHSISEPAAPSSTSPPPLPPRKGGSLDRSGPVRYQCQKCKRTIEAREISAHKEYCEGYLDLKSP